jgi:spermidine synthase
MARDFDNFPTYDPVIKDKTNYLSDTWASFMAAFIQTLQDYLTQNGVFIPQLTTAQRDALNNAVNGQLIYNTTTDNVQAFIAGTWTNL